MAYQALKDATVSWRARLDTVEELARESSIPIAARHATLGLCTNQPAPLAAAAARCVQCGLSDPVELLREVCARLNAARASSASEGEQLQALAAMAGAAELARANGAIHHAVRVALAGLLDGLQPLTADDSDGVPAARATAALTPAVAAAAQRCAAAVGAALGPGPLLGLLARWLADGSDGAAGACSPAGASPASSAAADADAATDHDGDDSCGAGGGNGCGEGCGVGLITYQPYGWIWGTSSGGKGGASGWVGGLAPSS